MADIKLIRRALKVMGRDSGNWDIHSFKGWAVEWLAKRCPAGVYIKRIREGVWGVTAPYEFDWKYGFRLCDILAHAVLSFEEGGTDAKILDT